MYRCTNKEKNMPDKPISQEDTQEDSQEDSKLDIPSTNVTSWRCWFASGLAGGIAYGSYLLFNSIVQTYATKAVTSPNPIVVNLTSAVRTMVMGIVALGTGIFGMVAIGLFLLGIQVTFQSLKET